MSSDLQARLSAAVGDRYAVDAEIGRGGMGVVYRAMDRRLKRRVAIKVLPPDLAFRPDVRSRFMREAQTAAMLSHPHIVPIYEVDEREGLVFFVMALVDGESLAARLGRESRPPMLLVLRVLRDVADALWGAHSRGVIHRDIKPDNILLEPPSDRASVTDFGIARALEGDTRLTATGIAVGTPVYMSPEQALGGDGIDGRSDLYSLAVVGYQMLVGEPPFSATNTPALLQKHVSDLPVPISERRGDAPAPLSAAIMRALAKEPNDRWANAAAFRDEMARILISMGVAVPGRASPSAERAHERRPGSVERERVNAPAQSDAAHADVVPPVAREVSGAGGEADVARPSPDAAAPSSEGDAAEPAPKRVPEDMLHVARLVPAAKGVKPPPTALKEARAAGEGAPSRGSVAANDPPSGEGGPPQFQDRSSAPALHNQNLPPATEPPRGDTAPYPPNDRFRDSERESARDAARRLRASAPPDDSRNDRIVPPRAPAAPALPQRLEPPRDGASLPSWMPESWREVRRQARSRERMRGGLVPGSASSDADPSGAVPLEQRIVAFRRQTASTAIRVGVLAAINAVTTPFFPWFLFPASFLGLRLAHRGSGLWADGVRIKDVFGPDARAKIKKARESPARMPTGSAISGPSLEELALRLAPRDVLRGPYGNTVRAAADDQRVALEALEKLGKTDREMIPDVEPTIKELAERVGGLVQALHRLDADVRPGALEELEKRIAHAKADAGSSSERERTIGLLERQRSTLADLRERRDGLAAQLESASLMLQNMRLDLLALRSAGVQASLDSASSATQEARELSREIGYVLGAAKEIRGSRRED